MSKQKILPSPEKMQPSLNDLVKKRELLSKAAQLYSKELTEEVVELWDGLLLDYSVDDCAYAFDYHFRNGRYFPKPADILEAIKNYRDTNALLQAPHRYPNHGQGYGLADVQILWKLHAEKRAEVNRPLTDAEKEACLDELDRLKQR